MKSKDTQLLEEAYALVSVNKVYCNTNLRNIFPEEIWNTNSLEAKLMFVEAFSIGQQATLLNEGILSNIGKTLLTPIQATGKIYSGIITPINSFVEKYGYEKTGLKEIDRATYNSVINKFEQFLNKLDPKVADFIRTSLKEAQSFVKGNPIKMSLLSVALTTAMSFAGAPMLAIFAAACLVRGTIGLLKGEAPIKAFGKSLLVGVIGKVIGLAGKELLHYFGIGDHSHTSSSIELEHLIKPRDFSAAAKEAFQPLEKSSDGISAEDMNPVGIDTSAVKSQLANIFTPNVKEIEINKKYFEILDQYQHKPVSLRTLLTSAWRDIGLSDEQAEKLVNSSFKNKNLVNVDLDHKSYFVFTEDVIQGIDNNDMQSISRVCKDITTTEPTGAGLLKNFNTMLKLVKYDQQLTANSSLEEWANSLTAIQNYDPGAFDGIKSATKNLLKEMIARSGGFTVPGNSVYYLNKNENLQELFRLIATHEALHTAQGEIPIELTKELEAIKQIAKDSLINQKLNDLKTSPNWSAMVNRFGGEEKITTNIARAVEKDLNYHLNPLEIQTWLGMAKKQYYLATNILIGNNSNDSEIDKFFKWLQKNNSLSSEYNYINKVDFLKRAMDATETGKQLFKDQLRDVAINDSTKRVSNIA